MPKLKISRLQQVEFFFPDNNKAHVVLILSGFEELSEKAWLSLTKGVGKVLHKHEKDMFYLPGYTYHMNAPKRKKPKKY